MRSYGERMAMAEEAATKEMAKFAQAMSRQKVGSGNVPWRVMCQFDCSSGDRDTK